MPPYEEHLDIHDRLRRLYYVLLGIVIGVALVLGIAQATGWPRMTLTSEVTIFAPQARVWSVLSDFSAYPEWNAFIPEASGTLEKGKRLTVRIAPPGGVPMTLTPKILLVTPGSRLTWRGRLFAPGVFDGEHDFLLVAQDSTVTRFTQSETFKGILVPLLAPSLNRNVHAGFNQMNEALKERAERLAAADAAPGATPAAAAPDSALSPSPARPSQAPL
jgi:hypothetical protein